MLEAKFLPARIDISYFYGDDLDLQINLATVDEDTKVETPFDFTGYSGVMLIERPGSDTAVKTWTTASEMALDGSGNITVTVASANIIDSISPGIYDLKIKLTSGGGIGKTYFAGSFKVANK